MIRRGLYLHGDQVTGIILAMLVLAALVLAGLR